MLKDILSLVGHRLGAADGGIGRVNDFSFDDQAWAVRYLVADTGDWMPSRQILLTRHAFGPRPFGLSPLDPTVLRSHLNRQLIVDSPRLGARRALTRRQEADYHDHYGWPPYWENDDVSFPDGGEAVTQLRGVAGLRGMIIQATDGPAGVLRGLRVDDLDWGIRELVVETGRWFTRKLVRIRVEDVVQIGADGSGVLVNLTRLQIKQTAKGGVVRARVRPQSAAA